MNVNRRTMIQATAAALAAGMIVTGDATPAAPPSRRPSRRAPEEDAKLLLLLPAVWEVEDAMNEVRAEGADHGPDVRADAEGMSWFFALFGDLFAGHADPTVQLAAEEERDRRRAAAAAGAFHGDPVYRALRALGGARQALERVVAGGAGRIADDARGVLFAVRTWHDLFSGSVGGKLTDAARRDVHDELLRDYQAGKLPRPDPTA